jgi:hypothetical protein
VQLLSASTDTLRDILPALARTGAKPEEIALRLDQFGWELDYLRES